VGPLPYREADSPRPRAVGGHTDLSARGYLRGTLGREVPTFAAPMALYREMEELVDESFLRRPAWRALVRRG